MTEVPASTPSAARSGWADLLKRSLLVAVVAFVVLQIKELKDAGRFDTVGTGVDGLLIGAGTFLVDAALGAARGPRGAAKS